jgi:Type I phosphodiesterase / nucleotide pyrophosphatase
LRVPFYGPKMESACTRLLYLMNTIDSYHVLAAVVCSLVIGWSPDVGVALAAGIVAFLVFKMADFFPTFLFAWPLVLAYAISSPLFSWSKLGWLALAHLVFFFFIQIGFMGIPDSIVGRNPRIIYKKLWLSLFTIAPTTVSLVMSVSFGLMLSIFFCFTPKWITVPLVVYMVCMVMFSLIALSSFSSFFPFRGVVLKKLTLSSLPKIMFLVAFYLVFGSLVILAATLLIFKMEPDTSLAAFLLWIITLPILLLYASIINWLLWRSKTRRSFISETYLPKPESPIAKRVVIINIDGCRLDIFNTCGLPFLDKHKKEWAHFPGGLQTVYRALTNPAFASILTGTLPPVHGVRSNNLGMRIRVEALPDMVPTILYGSMHVEHFSKREWEKKIVSLPTVSVYNCDEIMFDWLKEDMLTRDEVKLFVADISETDFLGHAYGATSKEYVDAMKRADVRIGEFFAWAEAHHALDDTVVIICSDHGIHKIDHSYLLHDAERYVPMIVSGKGIKKGCVIDDPGSITDIAPTISYILGMRPPEEAKGRTFVELLGEERQEHE